MTLTLTSRPEYLSCWFDIRRDGKPFLTAQVGYLGTLHVYGRVDFLNQGDAVAFAALVPQMFVIAQERCPQWQQTEVTGVTA